MNENKKRVVSGILYILIMWLGASYSETSFRMLFIILGILSIYEIIRLRKDKNKLIASIYILLPFILIQLKDMSYNENKGLFDPSLILFIFILTWTFDTFAYIFGGKFGRNKIMPYISPKKSWEGLIGGLVCTFIISYLTLNYFSLFNDIKHSLAITLCLPFTATIGDFIASYYKRKANVKDSGKLIPGHGGVIDRIDAFTITIPLTYLIIHI